MHRVLVLGGSGLVGRAVISEFNKDNGFQVYATYFQNSIPGYLDGRFNLDVRDCSGIKAVLDDCRPQSIISCMRGDYDKQLNLHIAAARFLKENGGRMYFCSTANVFDNDLGKPHYEDDATDSCTDYGQFKIECERKIIDILNDDACILRLPQMWGRHSERITSLLAMLNKGEKIGVYPGLLYNTNTDVMLAKQIYYVIIHKLNGIFHLAADDIVTHKDFYSMLAAGFGCNSVCMQENMEEQGYLALLSNRSREFPQHLRFTNSSVIDYLTN